MMGKVANYENPSGNVKVPVSFLTLRFEDSKLENSYQESLHTRQTQFLMCCLSFYLAMLFAACCELWAYLGDQTELRAIITQALVLGGATFVCTLLFLFAWWVCSQRIRKLCVSLVMLISACAFSLSDERFVASVLSVSYTGSSVSSFIPFALLTLPFADLMRHQLHLLMTTLAISTLIQIAVLLAGTRVNSAVFEFLLAGLMMGYLGCKMHQQEKKHRREFYLDRLDWTSVSEVEEFEQWEHGPMNTEREMLLRQLQETHEIISEVLSSSLNRNGRFRLKEALKRISAAGNTLRSGRSIDKPDLGKLTKSATAEYKNYLEENYWPQQVSDLRRVHPPLLKVEQVFAEELLPLLEEIDNNWNFDMLRLAEVSRGRPLQSVGEFCMKKFGLGLDEKRCSKFLQEVEMKYKRNPYHNSTHGADVTHSLLFLYKQSPLIKEIAELELLASVIAALCHDVGHPGLNNRYLINTKSPLTLVCTIYTDNDVSVLEMMHTALTYELLEQTELLKHLPWEQWAVVRKVVIELILATDMMKHFDLLGSYRAKQLSVPLKDFEDRLATYRLCIKCADVAHACKREDLHEKWTERVVEEFFYQGDLERDQHLAVSAFCDRHNSDIPTNQCGFILNLVRPMFEVLNSVLKSEAITHCCLDQFDLNVKLWKRKMGLVEDRMILKSRTGERLEVEESVHG